MVSSKNVRKLEKFISKLALLLKKHCRKNIGIYLFAKFLEIIVTHKLVGMVIARLRAIIVRRIRRVMVVMMNYRRTRSWSANSIRLSRRLQVGYRRGDIVRVVRLLRVAFVLVWRGDADTQATQATLVVLLMLLRGDDFVVVVIVRV